MREYKFRAWDGEKIIYQDNNGFFDKVKIDRYPTLQTIQFHSASIYCKIMQFTGLKENAFESGNKDIYEGDVIEFINGERLVVEWNDDTCQFQYSDGTPINNGERYGTHKMIVGNIYESPELRK